MTARISLVNTITVPTDVSRTLMRSLTASSLLRGLQWAVPATDYRRAAEQNQLDGPGIALGVRCQT